MLSYKDFARYFGISLFDKDFQSFLSGKFFDLTEYNILESDYIVSNKNGIELGFINNDAIYDEDENIVFERGDPIFSHFILYPKSLMLIDNLPLRTTFDDNRVDIIKKAGNPIQTKDGYTYFLGKKFLIDSYKVDNIIIIFDYDSEKLTINFIQVRDNDLVDHLKL